MPTQSRGFFSCDFCGLACDTLEEAKEHESVHCTQRPQQQQRPRAPAVSPYHRHLGPPPAYGTMGPLSATETESYPPPPYPEHPHYAQKIRCMPLMGPYDRGNLTSEDSIACQNIELFEAAPEHVADHDSSRTGGTPVVVKQVGLRCVYCSKSPLSAAGYSTVFTGSLGSLADSVRMVADNHLSTCGMAPQEIREACGKAASKRRRETGDEEGRNADDESGRSRMALLDYCIGFCQQLGIVNKQPHKTGIEFADDGETNHNHYYSHPGVAVETPSAPRGPPPPPYSGDRMGPPMSVDRMGYPTPALMSRAGPPMMGGPMGPGDAIAPTPLQRRRDRPGEGSEPPPSLYSAEREGGAPPPGYPTPYSQGPPGADTYGGPDGPGMQTPVQPNFEGQEGGSYPTPHSAYHSEASPPGYQQYDLPSNFPFYQESNRTWHCKFCSHVHPQYRDPQSVWSSPSGGPPPGNFIDQHLSMCRAYHQSMPSPPMYQGPPPPYGQPFMPPQHMPPYGPPGHWENSPSHAGMHLQYPPGPPPGEPPYPYPPHHLEHPPRYPGPEDPNYGDPRAAMGMSGPQPPGMPPHGPSPQVGMGGRAGVPPLPQRKENMADSVLHAINHLSARENEQFARDPRAAKVARLVLEEDRLLLTDYFFFLMKQLRLCRFSEADRKTRGGKREKIKLGYGGLQCIHCADVPNSRKFFWSNVDRLANSFAEIPGHILKCRRCPQQSKDALLQLKQFHPEQMARLPRGSQKVFFRRMWRRLHDEDPETGVTAADEANAENVAPTKAVSAGTPKATSSEDKELEGGSPTGTLTSEESVVLMQRSTKEAATALASAAVQPGPPSPSSRILLAIPDDKEWLSDMDCFIRKQLEVFCAIEDDVATAQSDRKYPIHVGQVGIRCIHCSMSKTESSAKGHAVAFPFAISGIYESVREFQRLHLDSCDNLPAATKAKLAAFKGSSSLSSVLRKYYVLASKALGLQDTREGIRSGGESVPLSSQAAFSFAEGGQMEEEMRRSVNFNPESSSLAKSPAPPPTSTPPKEESKKRSAPSSTPESAPSAKVTKRSLDGVGEAAEV